MLGATVLTWAILASAEETTANRLGEPELDVEAHTSQPSEAVAPITLGARAASWASHHVPMQDSPEYALMMQLRDEHAQHLTPARATIDTGLYLEARDRAMQLARHAPSDLATVTTAETSLRSARQLQEEGAYHNPCAPTNGSNPCDTTGGICETMVRSDHRVMLARQK
eukprot:COSAG02_NODE_1575_length_11877_cov_43.830871_2_plen_169_part_00